MKGTMATPKKNRNGNWTILVYVGKDSDGKNRYKRFTAETKKEVLLLAEDFQKETSGHGAKSIDMTVGDAVRKYIELKETNLSPKTIREYKCYLRNSLQGLVNVKLYSLTDEIIQEEIDRASETLSPKSVALRWGLFGTAIRKYRKGYTPSVELPRVYKKPVELPPTKDLIKIFDEIRGARIEAPFLLASLCGMRRGEISALDLAKDIDYEKCTVSITKAYTENDKNEFVLKEPKSASGKRVVICPKWAVERIQAYSQKYGNKMQSPPGISDAYAKLKRKYNLPCTFHGLRHYFASVMLALNVPEKYAMERMGHSTNSMLRHYQESMQDKEIEINTAMTDYFNSLNPDTTQNTTCEHIFKEKERK